MGSNGMIRCEQALARLMEYIDGELPTDEQAAVKTHLDICDRCYPQYDFQRAYHEFTRRIRERDHAPVNLRRRLFRLILEQEAKSG